MEITRRDIEIVTSARTKEQLFLYLKSKLSEQEQLDFIAESKDYIHKRYGTWIRDLVVCEGVDYHNLPAKRFSNRFPSEHVIYDCIDPDGFAEDIIDDFAKFLHKQLIVQKECLLFTNRDADICQKARLNKPLFNILLNSKLWEPEPTDYFPLTDDQMELFIKGYYPDWDCRYAPYFINGWFFIARSGHWLKKFRYQKNPSDGLYHVVENYTTPMVKGTNLLPEVLLYGYYERRIVDHRNDTLLKMK